MATKKTKANPRSARRLNRLRVRAEALLAQSPQTVAEMPPGEVGKLMHELRGYQTELEMQNEELRHVELQLEDALEVARDRFAQLYDLAPVGHLTLDHAGVVRQVNLTAAGLLGRDRHEVVKKKLSRFIAPESQDELYLHLQRVFTTGVKQRCDLQLRGPKGTSFTGHFESVAGSAGPGRAAHCLVSLTDVTRQRQVETALRENAERYRSLFENDLTGNFIAEPNGKILLCNPAFATIFGFASPEAACRSNLAALQADPACWPAILAQLKRHQRVERYECAARRRDGTLLHLVQTVVGTFNERDELVQIQAYIFDDTQRKRAEAALRESEEKFRSFVESTDEWIWQIDCNGQQLYGNPAVERILGYTPAEVVGHSALKFMTPASRREAKARLPQFVRDIKGWKNWELKWRHKDGSIRWLESNATPVLDASGQVLGFRGADRDITERRRAQEQLKQLNATLERRVAGRTAALTDANDRLRAITDNVLIGILTLNARGVVETLNPAAAEIFGYSRDELVGYNVGDLMSSPTQLPGEAFLTHYTQSGDQQFMAVSREVLGRRKDGQVIMLELTVSDFAHGGRREFVAMLHDVTARKGLERELLEIIERERQRLGHDLHDGLGQHLHGLSYLAALAEKGLREDASPRAAEVGQLNKYLNEALELTRSFARGLQPVNAAPRGLMMALHELAERTRGLYRVNCRFDCPAPVLIQRHMAATHLFRIAQEAVNNAMKHGKPTRIRIRLAATPQRIVLGVRDNGVGFRRRKKPARGMGLHIMQYRADAISGSLLVQRRPRGGTKVVCTVSRESLFPSNDKIK